MLNFSLLLPNFDWIPRLRHFGIRGDLVAGLTGALLAFPQAIALAALAGLPSEFGIYASMIPLMLAALWGSSWHAIGGTNTAMAMLLASALASMTVSDAKQAIAIVLVMTLLAGLFQLVIGLFSLGRILDFISSTVVATLTLAVSISMLIAVLPSALGSADSGSGSALSRLFAFADVIQSLHVPALTVACITLLTALLAKQFVARYAFIIGLLVGVGFFWLGQSINPGWFAEIKRLDAVSFELWSFALPDLSLLPRDKNSLVHIVVSAASLALLGMTQAIVIARSTAQLSGQRINTDREISGQGVANVSASLFSGFAVASSFSSSATNYYSGAISPLSAVIIALTVAIAGLAAADFLTLIPQPVIGGGLLFIALSMFKAETLSAFRRPRHEFLVFLATLVGSLAFGLVTGVLAGVLLSALVYLWFSSQPKMHVEEQTGTDGRPVHIITIEGSLFFGAVQSIETVFRQWTHRDGVPSTLVIRTDHLGYLDVPGTRLLLEEAKRRLAAGSDFYLYVVRDSIVEQLENSNLLPLIGRDRLIRPNEPHPMQSVLFPQAPVLKTAEQSSRLVNLTRQYPLPLSLSTLISDANEAESEDTQATRTFSEIGRYLRRLRLFSAMPGKRLLQLIELASLHQSSSGTLIATSNRPLDQVLIPLTGELAIDSPNTEVDTRFKRKLRAGDQQSILMPAALQGYQIHATAFCLYLLIDEASFVSKMGQSVFIDEGRPLSILDLITPAQADAIRQRWCEKTVEPFEIIIRQGDRADAFYILLQGEAEVVVHQMLDGGRQQVATLSAGDSFGEEGILQGTSRNAEVRMLTHGRVGIVGKADFEQLLMPLMAPTVDYKQARQQVDSGIARWLDCRFEPEYGNGTLDDAVLMPLNQIRQRFHELEPEMRYIVYCSNGRRSRAAAFLLRERNIDALFLQGGLMNSDYQQAQSLPNEG